ncbi:MAG TPA: amino acid ABC transporter permease [Mycobacteriales bacterium]|nr:amino acid ABC transporter permease [Mycobacteriales bacterium]
MTTAVLYDQLGPRGRRRVVLGSVLAYVAIAGVLVAAALQLEEKGQFESRRWSNLADPELAEFLAKGLWANVKAAAVAMVLALVFGAFFALGRLSRAAVVRVPATAVIELFRALPQLLLILAAAIVLPRYGFELPVFVYLIVGLTLYQGSVLAEIFRAGILSLDRGQSEASYSVGLSYGQTMRLVVIPQAVRRMLPSIISQLVTLFKDTSLGFAIGYEELLRRGKFATVSFGESLLQIYLLIAVIFIVVNIGLSRLARWLEGRQQRKYGAAGAAATVTGVEDLAVLDTK